MTTPSPQLPHQALIPLAGMWVGTETVAAAPGEPQGGTAEGHVDNRLDLDGFVMVQNYEQRRDGAVTYRGHAVVWWDKASRKYVMTWWDSLGQAPNTFRGEWQDDALVLTHRNKEGASRATMRVSGDEYRFTMEISGDGEVWSTWMTGEYRRADPAEPTEPGDP